MATQMETEEGNAQPINNELSPRNKLYMRISENLSESEVESLRMLMITDNFIARGRVQNARPHEIFNILEDDGRMGAGNLGLLKDLLRELKKGKLAEEAEDVEKLEVATPMESDQGNAQPINNELSPRNKLYMRISENLSESEVESLRMLMITDNFIARGRVQNARPHEIFNMLEDDGRIGVGNLGLLKDLLRELKKGKLAEEAEFVEKLEDLIGLSDADVKKAVSILTKTFQELRLDISDQSTSVQDTEEWKTTKTALEQSAHGLLKISVESSADSRRTQMLFTGESASVKDMMGRIDSYLKVKSVYKKQVEADNGVIRFIKDHQMANLQRQLEDIKVSIWYEGGEESPMLFIQGNTDGIQQADSILRGYIDSVISDQMSIKKPGMSKHFREQAGKSTLQHAERQCKCVIDIQDSKQFMPKSPVIVPRKKAVVNLDGGKKLVVWRDDITKHKADVIVNAANASLEHTGGLAKAIVDAGGDAIQRFCNDYIQANGTLIPGQVVATPPGRINTCQSILHAVGPIWKGGSSGEEDDLADAVYGSLEEAAKSNFRSILIPAISSGIYGYPLSKCAETIVTTTVEYLDENPDTSLDVVEFVNINDQTADAFVDALVSLCAEDKVETSYRRVGQTTNIRPYQGREQRGHGGRPQSGGPYRVTPYAPSRQPRDPVVAGFRTTEGKAISATQAMDKRTNYQPQGPSSAGNIKLPKTWTSMPDDDQHKEVDLQPTSAEYKTVHDQFMQSVASGSGGYYAVQRAQVLKITRIQNVTLWYQYIARKKKMELDNAQSTQPVERILYHGTPVDPIPSINHCGFNRSYSGRYVGAAFGSGVYFSVSASLSAADQYARPAPTTGHRYMYMARVLSGDMCQGQQGIIVPPAKDPSKPHITYDSVCDDLANPQIVVIFYDTQAYPEYLITFTK